MAGEERQNVTGSLCRLCWDGPPAPKEGFCHPPLALSELPGEATRREKPKCTLSASLHWLWGTATNYTVAVRSGWFSGSLLKDLGSFCNTLQSMACPAQLCSLTNRCAHFNSHCCVCEFPLIVSGVWKILKYFVHLSSKNYYHVILRGVEFPPSNIQFSNQTSLPWAF